MYYAVEFRSTFPNEWEFDANDNPIAPGAHGLAEAIVSGLATRVQRISPVEQHEYYGWGFKTIYEGSTFSNVLNPSSEECYLTLTMDWYALKVLFLRRPRKTFQRYSDTLRDVLNQIPEVSDVKWEPYRR